MPGAALRRLVSSERRVALNERFGTDSRADDAQRMAGQLREAGVELDDRLVRTVAASPERVAALKQRDFQGQDSAFGHILRIARTPTLADGTPGPQLAAELFGLAGAPGGAATLDTGPARTSQTILTRHHAGEFTRIVAGLAIDRRVTVASGDTLNLFVQTRQANLTSALWSGVHGALAGQQVAGNINLNGGVPVSLVGQQGELANLATRLTGHPFVNVPGNAALPHLGRTLDAFGPLPARYGDLDGNVQSSSLARISADGAPLRLIPGQPGLVESGELDLGFTTVPASLARAQRLPVAQYRNAGVSYAVPYAPDGSGTAQQPSSRTPSAAEMVDLMRQRGVDIPTTVMRDLARNPARVAALHQPDFQGRSTAFEHILRLADADTLRDGQPAINMARDLFELVGTSRAPAAGRCYARTSHAIFSIHHAGEFARLLADMGLNGETRLADGSTLRWDPQQQRQAMGNGQHVDWLWAGIAHSARLQIPPAEGLIDFSADYARQGEMANLHSRLSGIPHVNVQGQQALPHLQEIASRYGPMLAEYGAHGGSVARVENGVVFSQEAGQPAPTRANANLGYVVVPREEAEARGLNILQYPGQITGYIGSLSPEELQRLGFRKKLEQQAASSYFYLRFPNGRQWGQMLNAANFVDFVPNMPWEILEHHLRRGDFAAWVEAGMRRPTLAARIRAVQQQVNDGLNDQGRIREALIQAINDDFAQQP